MNILPRNGIFEKTSLPYQSEELQPVISKETLQYHYGKHLETYLNNLNALLGDSEFKNESLETIVQNSIGALFNNASQVLNHVLYFTQFQKTSTENKAKGYLKKAIEKQFNSFENFQNIFEKQGFSLFGSGWVWLSSDDSGNLIISQEENAKNPITKNLNPILTFDVWEHAYYIDFRNNRAEHLKSLWQIINWDLLELRYTEKHRYHF